MKALGVGAITGLSFLTYMVLAAIVQNIIKH
jgi:hypothetical protein